MVYCFDRISYIIYFSKNFNAFPSIRTWNKWNKYTSRIPQ